MDFNNNENSMSSMDCSHNIPPKPKFIMDEDGEEVTRKIAPTMIMPSLGPLPTMPMSMSSTPTFSTSMVKPLMLQTQVRVGDKRTASLTWELTAVPVLPESYQLERTATFVPNAKPQEVASRIVNVLRDRSIEAQYENGKAKVKCTTAEGVDFLVHLFRGRGRYSHGIIVEVQRFFGTSYVFHSDTKAILDGAEGKVAAPPPLTMTSRINILPRVPDGNEDANGASPFKSAESSLAMVGKMMKIPGFDSQHLGLQMLQPLVTSERLSLSTARAVAESLFEQDCEVGQKVFDYVAKDNRKTRNGKTKAGVFDDDDDEEEEFNILRNAALGILANAIIVQQKVPEHIRETLRPALLRDLNDAENHPNTALLAAKCLEYFIQEDDYDKELKNALLVAQRVGEAKHANLMHQAKKCVSIGNEIIR